MSDKPIITEDAIIRRYLGKPYKLHGRTIRGLDCYGLIILIYADCGHELWDINEEYDEAWGWKGKDYFLENYYRQWIRFSTPKLFDVVLFKNKTGAATHGGVVLNKGRFIHCVKNTGVIISRLSDWKYKTEGFYRLK
jgi:cell wall-associated NlpC family hydrolase